ncbi:hypothetical protein EMGR_003277 [Emarellia grisea]
MAFSMIVVDNVACISHVLGSATAMPPPVCSQAGTRVGDDLQHLGRLRR